MKVAIEHARAIVAQGADASSDGPFALARALLALHTRVEAMAAVVAAAVEWSASFGELSKRLPPHVHALRNAVDAYEAALDGYRGAK